jgi:Ca2+:H+ antiporter
VVLVVGAVVATAAAGGAEAAAASAVVVFVLAAAALATMAGVVGAVVRRVGDEWSPRATGLLQATVGNLPELVFGLFALRAGRLELVQAALVGSVLANVLLVLGVAFVVGTARTGRQRFAVEGPRDTVVVLLGAAAAVVAVAVARDTGALRAGGGESLSTVVAAVLLGAYVASLWFGWSVGAVARADGADRAGRVGAPTASTAAPPAPPSPAADRRSGPGRSDGTPVDAPLPAAAARRRWIALVVVLVAASVGAAAASDWLVGVVGPALHTLGVSSVFAGVVVVAVAGNAVENAGGIALAAHGRLDHAVASILESPAQVLLGVYPLLVLVGPALGGHLTLTVSPLLAVGLAVGALVAMAVVVDGEATWLEGVLLVGLYAVVAAVAFWAR